MSMPDVGVAEVTITQRLLALATERAGATALAGPPGPGGRGETYSYQQFATTVQAAAAGLAWRGLQPRDVVGVYAPDAISYLLATHAIRAAGGVPSPVNPALSVPEIAGQLAECGARMLVTAAPLADAALAAADRSWVRQVFSFTEAAGTIAVSALLGMGTLRPARGRPHDNALLPFSPGADGRLRPTPVSHLDLLARLRTLAARQAPVTDHQVVLATAPSGDGLAYTLLLDAVLLNGGTVVAASTEEFARAASVYGGTAVIVPAGVRISRAARLQVFTAA